MSYKPNETFHGAPLSFTANSDRDTLVRNELPGANEELRARYVRIFPLTWSGGISLRADVDAVGVGAGGRLEFRGKLLSAHGGQYRLCWCASGFTCTLAPDFDTDMGELVVIGPTPEVIQERTCVSGQTCRVDGLVGVHLGADRVALLDTCAAPMPLRRVPQTAVVTSTEIGAAAHWSATAFTVPGGLYRLCWSAF